MQNYGEALKYQREVANLTQPELAKQIGTSQANISRWERDEVIPNIDFCVKLAKFYEVSLNELLGLEGTFGTRVPAPIAPTTTPAGDSLTEKEKALLRAFKKLLPEMQDFILQSAQSLSDKASAKSLK